MKSWKGFVVAGNNGEVKANSSSIGPFGIWTVNFIAEDQVQFKSAHGKNLVVKSYEGECETFTLVHKGNGYFSFKSDHGNYLCAMTDGKLNANGKAASVWETFEVIPVGK